MLAKFALTWPLNNPSLDSTLPDDATQLGGPNDSIYISVTLLSGGGVRSGFSILAMGESNLLDIVASTTCNFQGMYFG